MKLYIVRDVTSKRIIGLFWCDFPELTMLVDEEINPVEAEYCRIAGTASLRWGSRGPKVGVDVPLDTTEDGPWEAYQQSIGRSMWAMDALAAFFGGKVPTKRWEPLPTLDRD
jgi:hypothetical protein